MVVLPPCKFHLLLYTVDELAEKLSDGLKIIDKSPFKGTQKLWILQHLLVPRIQWPSGLF